MEKNHGVLRIAVSVTVRNSEVTESASNSGQVHFLIGVIVKGMNLFCFPPAMD